MMGTREPLGRHIPPKLDEARLARQRDAISKRVEARRRSRWLLLLAPMVCAAVVALLLVRARGNRESTAMAGTLVQAPSGEPLPLTLLDGSRVVLDPEAQLSLMTLLPRDIRLDLKRGAIDLDVTHHEDRQFVVVAAGYEVRVLGTRFAVKLLPGDEQPALEVKVFRGRVRVTRLGEPTDLRVLGAGETWSTALGPTAKGEEAPSASPMTVATTEPMPSASPSLSPSASIAPPPPARIGAKELWSQAEAARASKRFQDEALALNTLRQRHRSDPRAGLAAFELGRLRQDTLHDPAGAAEAFADAIALAPNGPFREDAEARRIEALEMAGQRDPCREAKAAFLARYPSGIHRQRVTTMCEHR